MAAPLASGAFRSYGPGVLGDLRVFAAALVLAALAGCRGSSHEADLRAEAARLSRAIDQLREADNAHKEQWLRLLQTEPCQHLCDLKRTCEEAYREHLAAVGAIREVRASAGSLAPGSDGLERAAERLGEAERRLALSRTLSTRCVDAESELRLRLRL